MDKKEKTEKAKTPKRKKENYSNQLVTSLPENIKEETNAGNTPPRGGGRPTKYRDEYPEMLVEHMKTGLSFESFAGVAGVSFDTVHLWAKTHKEFSDAKKLGMAENLYYMERIARQATLGGIPGFNNTLWIFTMKNRFGWRDKPDDNVRESIQDTVVNEIEVKFLKGLADEAGN